jgi:CBS domain-containing protein
MATVADVMSTDVVTVTGADTLGQVARTMRKRNVGSALVIDGDNKPVGIITERELVESVASSRNPDVGTAQSWMSEKLLLVAPETSIQDAVETMRVAGVRHLPVGTDTDVVGVVSIRDLLASILS